MPVHLLSYTTSRDFTVHIFLDHPIDNNPKLMNGFSGVCAYVVFGFRSNIEHCFNRFCTACPV